MDGLPTSPVTSSGTLDDDNSEMFDMEDGICSDIETKDIENRIAAADAKKSAPPQMDTFFCPICITNHRVVHSVAPSPPGEFGSIDPQSCCDDSETSEAFGNEMESPPREVEGLGQDTEADGEGSVVGTDEEDVIYGKPFQLRSCRHVMCTQCLSAYCASKVMDGVVDIRCCYPVSDEQVDFRRGHLNQCNVGLDEEDIRRLLVFPHRDDSGKREVGGGLCLATNRLRRYERFKFDAIHGERSRRCPVCDHPKLFEMVAEPSELKCSFIQRKTQISPDEISVKRSLEVQFPASDGQRNASRESCVEKINSNSSVVDAYGDEKSPQVEEATKADECNQTSSPGETKESTEAEIAEFERRGRAPETIGEENTGETSSDVVGSCGNPKADNEAIREASSDRGTALAERHSSKETHLYNLKPKQPIVTCDECDAEFCYFHSNAHVGRTCDDYMNEINDLERKNEEYLQSTHSKRCPRCGVFVQKEGGCNQMQCAQCGAHFCWLCLAEVDDGTFPTHFQWWNLAGCPNMQLHDSAAPSRCAIIWARALALCQVVVIGIPALVLALISSVLCCCCVPGMGDNNRERAANCISFWGNCLTALFFIPVILPGLIIGAVIVIVATIWKTLILVFTRVMEKSSFGNDPANMDDDSSDISGADSDFVIDMPSWLSEMESSVSSNSKEPVEDG